MTTFELTVTLRSQVMANVDQAVVSAMLGEVWKEVQELSTAVSSTWGVSFRRNYRAPLTGFGVDIRADF